MKSPIPAFDNPPAQRQSGNLPAAHGMAPPAFQLQSKDAPVQRTEEKSPAEEKRDKNLPAHTYPLTPEQLKNILARRAKTEGWDEPASEEKALFYLTLALRLNRKNMSRADLGNFEKEVVTHFPKTGPIALARVATGQAEEMSEWRQSIVKRSDEILGKDKMIKEGSMNFSTYVIGSADLAKAKAKKPSYTTCIDWQPKLLKYGVAEPVSPTGKVSPTRFKLKSGNSYPLFYGAAGIEKAKGMGIWNAGEPGMPKSIRPRPGDIMILLNQDTRADQHVCVMKSVEVLPDGREKWISSDGGQSPDDGTTKQAAKEVVRIYDPKTNVIAGEKGYQPGQAADLKGTWMAGWVDADGLVEDTDPTATAEAKEAAKASGSEKKDVK